MYIRKLLLKLTLPSLWRFIQWAYIWCWILNLPTSTFFFSFKEFRNYILGIIRAWSLMFPILILQYTQVCIYYLLFCEFFFFCVFWAFNLMSYLPNSKYLFNYYLNKCHLAISDLVLFLQKLFLFVKT